MTLRFFLWAVVAIYLALLAVAAALGEYTVARPW